MDENAPTGMPFSLDDVTSKIAYAYSKQQVFAWFGLFALLGVLGPLAAQTHDVVALGLDAVVAAVGAGILALVLTQRDLKRINRTSWYLSAVPFLAEIVLFVLSDRGVLAHQSASDLSVELSAALTALAMFISYPQPIRRGDSVLFKPAEIAQLSKVRTLAFGCLFMIAIGVSTFVSPTPIPTGRWVDPNLFGQILLVLGALGMVLFVLQRKASWFVGALTALAMVGLAAAVVGAANVASSADVLEDALAPVVGLALLLVVILVLSPILNKGKTIIGHRA